MIKKILTLAFFHFTTLVVCAQDTVDLSGEWKMAFDPDDYGLKSGPLTWKFPETITLPNTTARAGKGEAAKISPALSDPWVRFLHQKHPYTGVVWYQKSVEIPPEWKGKDVTLTLERVLWQSRLWVNGKPVEKPQDALSVPHRYKLSSLLKAGEKNTITLRIDNRQILPIGNIGHGYTDQTQSIWNGVVGELKLDAVEQLHISHIRVRTDTEQGLISAVVEITNQTGKIMRNQAVNVAIEPAALGDLKGKLIGAKEKVIDVPVGISLHAFKIKLENPDDIEAWSEFTPVLHQLMAQLGDSKKIVSFGYRSFTREGRKLMINGKPVFLRGNLECCIFPKTGHPDMTGEQWEKIMKTSKAWGLNHIRFHSWCPPKIAFEMADKYGLYLQIELPNWTFKMGQAPKVDNYFKAETERIFREYANHPSFVMFCLGNELKGDYQAMDKMLDTFKSMEPDLLYTSTAYSFSKRGLIPGPSDDFFITQRSKSGWVRGQGFLNENFPSTNTDYTQGLKSIHVPLVTHEVGQYHVFPDLREIEKYTESPLRPTAWEAIRDDLKRKGRLDLAARYTRDSGKLSALLYKEDIERALRSRGLSGIQLLQLQDFPGQGTATVGLIDSFWDSKGVMKPEEFYQFNSPTVPLVRMDKFVWSNDELFKASIEVAHFGQTALSGYSARWTLMEGDTLIDEGSLAEKDIPIGNGTALGTIQSKLDKIEVASKLKLTVHLGEYQNSWSVWVYPKTVAKQKGQDFEIYRALTDEAVAALKDGKRVLLNPVKGALKKPLAGRFIPVFWSPVHFKNQPASIGASILTDHPCWSDFPTDSHTDWQWWELMATSTSIDLSGIAGIDPRRDIPFSYIDKFNRNALPGAIFEAKVGKGKLLVCTLDIESDLSSRIVARQLQRSLSHYLGSEQFKPQGELSISELQSLIGAAGTAVAASSEHPDYPADNVSDGNKGSFWHSDWRKQAKMPLILSVDLLNEKLIKGFNYTPRQDMARGRIKQYQIQVSKDGEKWANLGKRSEFKSGGKMQTVNFKKPVKLRYIRMQIFSVINGDGIAACAGFELIEADAKGVKELGIIPGFND